MVSFTLRSRSKRLSPTNSSKTASTSSVVSRVVSAVQSASSRGNNNNNSRRRREGGEFLDDDEQQDDAEEEEPHYHDAPSDMTNGRRVARHLSRYRWYNPSGGAREEYELAESRRGGASTTTMAAAGAEAVTGAGGGFLEYSGSGLDLVCPPRGMGASADLSSSSDGGSAAVAAAVAATDDDISFKNEDELDCCDESNGPSSEPDDEPSPSSGKARPPSLDAAWAHFEHITLPRYYVEDGGAVSVSRGVLPGLDPAGASSERSARLHARAISLKERTSLKGRTVRRVGRNASRLKRKLKKEMGGQKQAHDEHNKHAHMDLLERAAPGENSIDRPTQLYSVWGTPEADLADFGVGVGLYFNSLKALCLIFFVAGLLNVPLIMFYSSTSYAEDGAASISKRVLAGAAICTDVRWRACPNCEREDWNVFPKSFDRYATATTDDGEETLRFILENACGVGRTVGLYSFLSLLWVAVSVHVMGYYGARKEIDFDKAQQTATDYSIEVRNPPEEAYDPEEWRQFFGNTLGVGAQVNAVTVAIDNEDLVDVLRRRRALLLRFDMELPPGVKVNPPKLEEQATTYLSRPLPRWKKLLRLATDPLDLVDALRTMDRQIEDMSREKRSVTNVFVTFETEKDQRDVLEALSVGRLHVWRNNLDALPSSELLFRGLHVLSVREPPEPSAVRWQDLDSTLWRRLAIQALTMTGSLALIVVGGVLIAWARREKGAAWAAITITVLNTLTPQLVHLITNLESHPSEGSKQTSKYIKMSLFRWCNTAIVTTIITPFTDTLQDGKGHLINGVYAIFITEMVKTPLIKLTDIMGNLNRHVLGPRALDQRRMNLKFSGEAWELAERYTDMTKILFLCFFYSVVFPQGFFFASLTLFVHYWIDKFCLLRLWAPGPMIGTTISKISRSYFFPLAILVYAVMLSYGYATFPYDNACAGDTEVPDAYVGTYNATSSDPTTGDPVDVTISIQEGDPAYFFCNQDLIRRKEPAAFPALPDHQSEGAEWMTPEQERWSTVLGWTSIAALCVVCLVVLKRLVLSTLRGVFCATYEPSRKALPAKFSEVENISGYVPQVRVVGYPFPKLLCDVDEVDTRLMGWTDPSRSLDEHNLIFDVPRVAKAVAERRAARASKQRRDALKTTGADDEEDTNYVENELAAMQRGPQLFSIVKTWSPAFDPEEEEFSV